LREVAEKRCSVLDTIWLLIPVSFGVLTLAPLCPRLATIDELSAHSCLTLEKRVRIGEVDSEGSTTNIDVIKVSNSGQSCFVVYGAMYLVIQWEVDKRGERRTCEFAETVTPRFSGLPIKYKPYRMRIRQRTRRRGEKRT
jgi:hypothetical protein